MHGVFHALKKSSRIKTRHGMMHIGATAFIIPMKSLELFSRNLREHFFLKIGILSAKVYKKRPQHRSM